MKKYLLTLFSVLVSVTLMGQTSFTVEGNNRSLTYTVIQGTNVSIKVNYINGNNINFEIPETVQNGNTTYTVTEIAENGFQHKGNIISVTIPETITKIGNNAFQCCSKLTSINLPATLTTIGSRAFESCYILTSINIPQGVTEIREYTFSNCQDLATVQLPEGLTKIGNNAFESCYDLATINFPQSLTEIGNCAFQNSIDYLNIYLYSDISMGSDVFKNCNHISAYLFGDIDWPNSENNPLGININKIVAPCSELDYYISKYSTDYTNNPDRFQCIDIYITKSNGDFDNVNTWNNYTSTPSDNSTPGIDDYFIIQKGDTITLDHIQRVKSYRSLNNGVLKIVEGGQLIEIDDNNATNQYRTDENVSGVIEVVTPATQGLWNFVGAPFNGYDLYAMKLGPGNTDATVVEFDYGTNDWSMNYSYANTNHIIGAGEGFFAWPFYDGGITFSTKRDYSTPNSNTTPQDEAPVFALNSGDVEVSKSVTGTDERGRWLALVNPYPAKLSIDDFISNNSGKIRGGCIYILSNNLQDNSTYQSWDDVQYDENRDLNVGQGFFVNLANNGNQTITFTKTQLTNYNGNKAKSEIESEKEFIRFAMIEGERESEVLFAHNQDAQEGYDIFDANKLFAMSHIAEPYFVVDGISLVKEEVNLLPYYATMNVKSFGNKEVKFRPNYIPEGLSVTLIDGEESIDLLQGQEYATEISAGENANRFKLLIKKSLGLSDVEELEVNISNDNRIVNIATSETDLQIEVYNALGQKVFETKALNFSLNNVSAGAYMIKVFNNKASKTQKIVVK